jgi:hypothetical protein
MLLFNDASSQLPAYMQGHTSDATAALKGNTTEGNRISIRGRVWRLIQDGQEIAKSSDTVMDLVVIDALPDVSRTYFATEYSENDNAGPDCWSTNGITPDNTVGTPCATACAVCPNNTPGSGNRDQNRACRFSKRIAVALPGDASRAYLMQIPATSLFGDKVPDDKPKSLQQYGRFLAARNADITTLVTRFQFDIDATQPTIRFSAQRYLTAEEFAAACTLMRNPETKAMLPLSYTASASQNTHVGISGTPPVAQSAAQPAGFAPSQPAGFAPSQPAGFAPSQPTAQPAGFAPSQPTAQPTAQPADFAPVQKAVAEPVVVSASEAAVSAGVAQGDVASLLSKWGAK